MWTLDFFVQLVSVTIGSAGLAILFGVRPKHLPFALVGASLTFIMYSFIEHFGMSLFSAAFISTAFAALLAELCARWRRAPAMIFLLPFLFPTIPGGSLYRTMSNLLLRDYDLAFEYFMITMKVSIGIAGGIVTVSLFVKVIVSIIDIIKNKNKESNADEDRTEI